MKERTREEPKILAAAEQQMRAWVKTQEIADRAVRTQQIRRLAREVQPYLAISREEGAGGSEIAQVLGQELGWQVLDKNLLDCVAERFNLNRSMLEQVDETRSSWMYDVLGTWMDRKIIPTEKYFVYLSHFLLAAARDGSVVVVGRGAQFLLPPEQGVAVRVIAPLEYRVEQVVRREQVDEAEARRLISQRDLGRREFVAKYFHREINDPHLYHLVINVGRIGPTRAVEQILAALRP